MTISIKLVPNSYVSAVISTKQTCKKENLSKKDCFGSINESIQGLFSVAFEHLSQFVADADRRTEVAKKRLAETQEELSVEASEKLNRVHELAEAIGKKLAAAEAAGSEGNVEESLRLMEEVEKIKKEKNAAETEYKSSIPTSSYQQQKLRVCEVCSAYLGIQDNDRRLADHFGGKLHLGFITIREKLEELRELVETNRKKGVYKQLKRDGNTSHERGSSRYDSDRSGRSSRYDNDRRRRSRSRSKEYPERDRDRNERRSHQNRNRYSDRGGSSHRDRSHRNGHY
ncbi:putative RNA-binding protein Luc7-like 2 isoform X2 [Dermatophagoides farinae]|uniref:RNA-binding protein Luc7-like 1, variant 4 n=1 Tax=Dermatophagoides farinae TaxID=6954 RepID=A0A922I0C5_DERFA|nr:putative RNA-binding protein Luc7-like 1 isoform X2 [Dermatophagoides farinae]XP_046918763.1 putative RNA-binding protein Luc7-like 1 isoform X2 [Dermatophagoides farinae]KAH9516188.1 putative RNA-binding protein Luc7-like 1, variant 4 [Dermatophagoides farinae]